MGDAAPILSGGGHQGYSSTNQDTKVEDGIESDIPNDTYKATRLTSEGSFSTPALSTNTSPGACKATDPPHGFSGVTACLHTPELVEVDLEVPVSAMPIGLLMTLGISSMGSSHIMKGELTGMTYMDTVTTSIGRVTISGPGLEALPTSPTIEDITDCQ